MKKNKHVIRLLVSVSVIIVIAVSFIGCDGGITSTGIGTSAVTLGAAGNYVILAKTGVSTEPTSAVTGDVGLSPAAETYLTGFSQTGATGYATSPQVTGKLYAADMTSPTPSNLTTAISDMQTAYNFAAGRTKPDTLNLKSGAIGMTGGGPAYATTTMGIDLYLRMDALRYSEASTAGVFLILLGTVVITLLRKLLGKSDPMSEMAQ